MNKRIHASYSGQVQGVGFRYTARSVAQSLGLNGWVKNTYDGGVELVLEGDEATLKQALDRIKQEMNHTSFKVSISWEPGTGEFNNFGIRF